MSVPDLTDRIVRTCPFLDRLCIGYSCPSFDLKTNTYPQTKDGVLLQKREKGKIFTKIKDIPMAIQTAWVYHHIPRCNVLGRKERYGFEGGWVGESFDIIREIEPRWTRVNSWPNDWEKVTELPEIQSLTSKAKTDEV